jgi:hypothetical protein
MKLISVLVFMVMAVAILVDAVPMKHLGSSAAGQDDPAPSQPPSFDKSAFRKGSWLMRDHSRSSVTELEKELAFAMVEKKPTKVIKMLVDMRAECNIDSNLSPKEESLAIDACRWKAQIIQASTWLGRKLQKELNEAEPDAEDLAEKLAWLNEHDALALLSAANPTLVSEAQAELDRLSSLAVTEATSTTNRKRGRAEVIFVLALPGAGKTTVSKKATEATGCSAISIGELARQACETGGPLCKKIRNMRMVGAAEDPSLSVGLLKEELKYRVKHQDEACFIVDGFPRSLAHLAEWADEKMNERFVVSTCCGLIRSCFGTTRSVCFAWQWHIQ